MNANAGIGMPHAVAFNESGDLFILDYYSYARIQEVMGTPIVVTASATNMVFTATSGGAPPAAQSFNISSSMTGVSFSVSTSDRWLSVTPSAGSTPGRLAGECGSERSSVVSTN